MFSRFAAWLGAWHAGSNGELSQQEGQLLEQSVQAILDDYRSQHVAAARNRYMSFDNTVITLL